jgi:hypothetical protein
MRKTGMAHRDGSRQIISTILVLPDAQAATAALDGARAELAGKVANGQTQPAAVGAGGTMVSTTIEFDGAPKDPAPGDLVLELGQKQDTAIRDWQAAWKG